MAIEGVDVSNHQAVFDFRGWQFAIVKASEGNGFKDFRFWQHVNAARAAGLIVAAYHYQRDVSARSQFDLIRSVVPTSIPVIIDVEEGSGSLDITRALIKLLRDAGYSVPLLYLPRWHWQNIGRPSLSDLPPLWGSDYRGSGADWSDYGGLSVALRQYTSTPHDKNWFGGTREQFAALLGGASQKEDDMTPDESTALWELHKVVVSGDKRDAKLNADLGYVLEQLREKLDGLETKVDAISTGGVNEEEIGRIARNAVGSDLKNDEE